MGKPIAGRDKFPYGKTGIVVAGAKLQDGTAKTDLHISKQRSVLVFDLLDSTDALFQKLTITSKDANGDDLDLDGADADLADSLAPGTFFVRAVNSADEKLGFVIRFQLNKVVVGNGDVVFDMDYSKGANAGVIAVAGVTVTPSTAAVKVGGTVTLVPMVTPTNATDKSVTWSSATPANATVNASTGVVTGVANGTSVITATTTDGSKTDTSTVTVTTDVVSVSIAPKTASLSMAGTKTQQLTPTVLPATASVKTVTYVSSDPTVATVSASGLVTALKIGTCTITVTTDNGAKTDTCAVTVAA